MDNWFQLSRFFLCQSIEAPNYPYSISILFLSFYQSIERRFNFKLWDLCTLNSAEEKWFDSRKTSLAVPYVLRKLETTQTYNFLLELYLIKLREATQPFSIIPDSDLWFQILTCILTMKGRASCRFPMYADERKILYWIFLVGGGGCIWSYFINYSLYCLFAWIIILWCLAKG